MTNAWTEALAEYFANNSFLSITRTTSLLAIGLLLLVAFERELIRAGSPDKQRRNVAAFAVVVIPMVVIFVTVIIARFVRLS